MFADAVFATGFGFLDCPVNFFSLGLFKSFSVWNSPFNIVTYIVYIYQVPGIPGSCETVRDTRRSTPGQSTIFLSFFLLYVKSKKHGLKGSYRFFEFGFIACSDPVFVHMKPIFGPFSGGTGKCLRKRLNILEVPPVLQFISIILGSLWLVSMGPLFRYFKIFSHSTVMRWKLLQCAATPH